MNQTELEIFLAERVAEERGWAEAALDGPTLTAEQAATGHYERWAPSMVVAQCDARDAVLTFAREIRHAVGDSRDPEWQVMYGVLRYLVQPYRGQHVNFDPDWRV